VKNPKLIYFYVLCFVLFLVCLYVCVVTSCCCCLFMNLTQAYANVYFKTTFECIRGRDMWARHLGSFTTGCLSNWVSFDFNASYSSCSGYSLINTLKLKQKYVKSIFIGPRSIAGVPLSQAAPARVPGLPIRDCARGCNNRSQTRPKLSAIDEAKTHSLSVRIWF